MIQPANGNFIEKLLNIYTTYNIRIIFVHTKTFSKNISKTCKSGVEKYLKKIFQNNNKQIEVCLKNYINVLLSSFNKWCIQSYIY